MVSVHRLTTGCVTVWLRPLSTAVCTAATGPPLVRLGLWPTLLATSSQRTEQFTAAQSWLFTGCLQTPTTASSCAKKEPSRSVVQLDASPKTARFAMFRHARLKAVYQVDSSLFGGFKPKFEDDVFSDDHNKPRSIQSCQFMDALTPWTLGG